MRDHAKPVRDRLKGFDLVVHAGLCAPPGTLMHKGAVGRIHETDDAVVDGAIQNRGDLNHAIGFGGERESAASPERSGSVVAGRRERPTHSRLDPGRGRW